MNNSIISAAKFFFYFSLLILRQGYKLDAWNERNPSTVIGVNITWGPLYGCYDKNSLSLVRLLDLETTISCKTVHAYPLSHHNDPIYSPINLQIIIIEINLKQKKQSTDQLHPTTRYNANVPPPTKHPSASSHSTHADRYADSPPWTQICPPPPQ